MDEKIRDYFDSGRRLVWLIDPEAQRPEICRSPTGRRLIGSGGFLEGEDVLPGFRHRLADPSKSGIGTELHLFGYGHAGSNQLLRRRRCPGLGVDPQNRLGSRAAQHQP